MTTGAVNAKSQIVAARVPHKVMSNVEAVKMPGKSTGQSVTAALKRGVEYRQWCKAKEPE